MKNDTLIKIFGAAIVTMGLTACSNGMEEPRVVRQTPAEKEAGIVTVCAKEYTTAMHRAYDQVCDTVGNGQLTRSVTHVGSRVKDETPVTIPLAPQDKRAQEIQKLVDETNMRLAGDALIVLKL